MEGERGVAAATGSPHRPRSRRVVGSAHAGVEGTQGRPQQASLPSPFQREREREAKGREAKIGGGGGYNEKRRDKAERMALVIKLRWTNARGRW